MYSSLCIIGKLAKVNDLNGIIIVADFNDDEKFGITERSIERNINK
ncbi:MAG: hypothetical protein U9O87_09115 [Verrucomicrobiota bacterium]|nr:hypothetical protein [Verrucomicrobiota bacterium]